MANERTCLVVVAHPDDEILWAGGTILMHPRRRWTIISLCRRRDADRAPRFFRVLKQIGADGWIGDLDDGPDQTPLSIRQVEAELLPLLPQRRWDIVITHSPFGEYTRHRRHEEVSRAVTAMWMRGDLQARDVRLFAYEDDWRRTYPRAIPDAHVVVPLRDGVWERKRDLVTKTYGFAVDSWEGQATPRVEAFWRFSTPDDYRTWLESQEVGRRGVSQ